MLSAIKTRPFRATHSSATSAKHEVRVNYNSFQVAKIHTLSLAKDCYGGGTVVGQDAICQHALSVDSASAGLLDDFVQPCQVIAYDVLRWTSFARRDNCGCQDVGHQIPRDVIPRTKILPVPSFVLFPSPDTANTCSQVCARMKPA